MGYVRSLIDSTTRRRALGSALALAFVAAAAALVSSQGQNGNDAADLRRLVEGLGLRAGMTVAEIGAGDGSLSIALARQLGAASRLYATELGDSRIKALRSAVADAHLDSITVVAGAATDTRLPDACCDAIFMRDVYHHFDDPDAMNGSLVRSLKPCGLLGIIDFTPGGQESPTPAGRSGGNGMHGITAKTLDAELAKAGFTVLSDRTTTRRNFFVVARPPTRGNGTSEPCPPAPQGS
jgi:ubiquinone/menaquinone biosynthesis C-methylase UbiE